MRNDRVHRSQDGCASYAGKWRRLRSWIGRLPQPTRGDFMIATRLTSPPPICAGWAVRFSDAACELAPELSPAVGLDLARLAFASTWLLEPEEAAQLWLDAMMSNGLGEVL